MEPQRAEIRSQQSKRMQELVSISMTRVLTQEETAELIALRVETGLSNLGRELELTEQTRKRIESRQDVLDALEQMLREEQ